MRNVEREHCSSSAFRASHCCCWLDVIQRDSIGGNRSWLAKKLHSKHLYLYLCVPPGIGSLFLSYFLARYFSLCEFGTWNTSEQSQMSLSPPTLSHCSPSIQKVREGKVGSCWKCEIGTSKKTKNKKKTAQPWWKQMQIHLNTGCFCSLYLCFESASPQSAPLFKVMTAPSWSPFMHSTQVNCWQWS